MATPLLGSASVENGSGLALLCIYHKTAVNVFHDTIFLKYSYFLVQENAPN